MTHVVLGNAEDTPSRPAVRRHWLGGSGATYDEHSLLPLVIAKGKGVWLWDDQGRKYFDAISSLEAVAVGHGRREIADAIRRQYDEIEFCDTLRHTSPTALRLAERLSELAPGDLTAVHFASSGSEAVESALKIARQYHFLRGHPDKFKVVTRVGAYHGCTFGTMALDGGYYRTRTRLFEPLPPIGRHVISPDNADDFDELILSEDPGTVAAVVVDPMATASGVYPPPPGYWRRLREICDARDVLLIADEVITGFGRTGRWFASDAEGVCPDIITVSKALTSGYFPLSAAIVSQRVAGYFDGSDERVLFHGHTFGSHPVAAAAALENLRIIEQEDLVGTARARGEVFAEELATLLREPWVRAVRGTGLLWGVELDGSAHGLDPLETGRRTVFALRNRGVLSFVLHPGNVLLLAPPLCTTNEEMRELVQRTIAALRDVNGGTLEAKS